MSRFQVIVLGCSGGPFESNLSSYVLIDREKKEGILLDAGTLLHGLQIAHTKGALKEFALDKTHLSEEGSFFLHNIKSYLISHAHLDHILGLVVASQVDTSKSILALDVTIDYLRDNIFNGKIWPNFGNEGEKGSSLYKYLRLKLGEKTPIPGTRMFVEPFSLNHSKTMPSSAFLIECEGDYALYFGDTSSDFVENEKKNRIIWEKISPLISKLKVIFLECTFPNTSKEGSLYGHLTPKFFLKEFEYLAESTKTSLKGLKVIVAHRKDVLEKQNIKEQIASELINNNHLGLDLIFPNQGDSFFF